MPAIIPVFITVPRQALSKTNLSHEGRFNPRSSFPICKSVHQVKTWQINFFFKYLDGRVIFTNKYY